MNARDMLSRTVEELTGTAPEYVSDLRSIAEHGDAPSRLFASELLRRYTAGWRPDRVEEDDDGNAVLVSFGREGGENRIVIPPPPPAPEVDDWTARFVEALDLGPYPPLPTDLVPGEPVVLTVPLGDREQDVAGRFVACFDDDDPDDGRGRTFRILAGDGQVWEGPTCVPRSEA